MSTQPTNIEINFVANYAGIHRVCYRLGNTGDYTCIETNCAVVGACQALIPIFVDPDTCPSVQYTGYIQAGCLDISSTVDRVAWEVTFVPSPNCKSYTVTCAKLGIASITVTNGGSNYVTKPTVSFVGGGGDATAIANIGEGGASNPIISDPGAGYVDGTYTNVSFTGGGGGAGALATIIVSGGNVTSVVITTAGTGYTEGDILNPDATLMGPSTPSVPAAVTVSSNGGKVISVSSIVNITPFTSVPTIVFTGGGGADAAATVVMEDCPLIEAAGCSGSPVNIAAGVLTGLGETVNICGFSTPSVNSAYTVAQNGNCLCNCTTATIGVSGSPGDQVRYTYNKCGLEVRSGILTVGGSPSSIVDCIVPNSLVFQILSPGASGTVSYGAACS